MNNEQISSIKQQIESFATTRDVQNRSNIEGQIIFQIEQVAAIIDPKELSYICKPITTNLKNELENSNYELIKSDICLLERMVPLVTDKLNDVYTSIEEILTRCYFYTNDEVRNTTTHFIETVEQHLAPRTTISILYRMLREQTDETYPMLFIYDIIKSITRKPSLTASDLSSLVRILEFMPYTQLWETFDNNLKEEIHVLVATINERIADYGSSVFEMTEKETKPINASTNSVTIEEIHEDINEEIPLAGQINNQLEQNGDDGDGGVMDEQQQQQQQQEEEEEPVSIFKRIQLFLMNAWSIVSSSLLSIIKSPYMRISCEIILIVITLLILCFNLLIVISLTQSTPPINTVNCTAPVSMGYQIREWFNQTWSSLQSNYQQWKQHQQYEYYNETKQPVCPPCELTPCPPCSPCPECPECQKCQKCPTCQKCQECQECQECQKCQKCPTCQECPTCQKCPDCPECQKCPDCPECPTCPECPVCKEESSIDISIQLTKRIALLKQEIEKLTKQYQDEHQKVEELTQLNKEANELAKQCQIEKIELQQEQPVVCVPEEPKKENEDKHLINEALKEAAINFIDEVEPTSEQPDISYDPAFMCILNEANKDRIGDKGNCEEVNTNWKFIVVVLLIIITILVSYIICHKRKDIVHTENDQYDISGYERSF